MQDGATPHTALSTRAFLNRNFRNRIIGKHFDWPWPPHSPDSTPAEFYLWPVIKQNMYTSPSAFDYQLYEAFYNVSAPCTVKTE